MCGSGCLAPALLPPSMDTRLRRRLPFSGMLQRQILQHIKSQHILLLASCHSDGEDRSSTPHSRSSPHVRGVSRNTYLMHSPRPTVMSFWNACISTEGRFARFGEGQRPRNQTGLPPAPAACSNGTVADTWRDKTGDYSGG